MQDIKTAISLIAVSLTIVGYIPYLRDTFKKKTTPHIYTWFIWGTVTAIAYALQVNGGAGVGSWVTLSVAIIAYVIFAFGLRNGSKDITSLDTLFFILSLVAIFLWLIAKQPVFSIILIVPVEMFGFVPTVRKSWDKPYSETLSFYYLNSFRFGLAVVALQKYSIITAIYPITWLTANSLFALMLNLRRRQIPAKQSVQTRIKTVRKTAFESMCLPWKSV